MKVTCIVHTQWSRWQKKYEYSFDTVDMTDYGYSNLGEIEIEFECPSADDLLARTIRALRAKLEATRVKHFEEQQSQVQEIEELLCLEAPAVEEITEADDDIQF